MSSLYDVNGIDSDGYAKDGTYVGEEYYNPEAEESESYWAEVDAEVDAMKTAEYDGLS